MARKRWLWKLTIGLVLIVGYAGYYVCRSNLSVASPSLIKDLDLSKSTFGAPHTSSFMGPVICDLTEPFDRHRVDGGHGGLRRRQVCDGSGYRLHGRPEGTVVDSYCSLCSQGSRPVWCRSSCWPCSVRSCLPWSSHSDRPCGTSRSSG